MKKKLLSLLLTAALVMGLIPVMSAVTVSAAGETEYFADNFENYNVGAAFSSENAVTDKDGITKWTMDASIKAEIVSVIGYDGKTTQAMKVYSDALTTKHKFKLSPSNSLPSSVPFTYEFKIFLPEASTPQRILLSNFRWYAGLRVPNSDSGAIIARGDDVFDKWTKVRFVSKADGNVLIYINDVLVSYNDDAHIGIGAMPSEIQFRAQSGTPPFEIMIDDINFYYSPAATTASSTYKNAEDVALTAKPTVTFTEALLDTTANSDATVTITDKTNGGSTTAPFSVSADGKTLTIDPETDLAYGTQYEIALSNFRDVYDAAITGDTTFTFTTIEQPKYAVTEPTFKKHDLFAGTSNEITELENGTISCEYSITNNHDEAKPVLFLVVLYEGGELKQFQFKAEELAPGATSSFSGGFTVGNAANAEIQTFMWNSLSGMAALAPSHSFTTAGLDK